MTKSIAKPCFVLSVHVHKTHQKHSCHLGLDWLDARLLLLAHFASMTSKSGLGGKNLLNLSATINSSGHSLKEPLCKISAKSDKYFRSYAIFKFLGGRLVGLVGLVRCVCDAPKALFVIVSVQYWSMQKTFSLSLRVFKIWAFNDFFGLSFCWEFIHAPITKN